jgi:hypothetical protein
VRINVDKIFSVCTQSLKGVFEMPSLWEFCMHCKSTSNHTFSVTMQVPNQAESPKIGHFWGVFLIPAMVHSGAKFNFVVRASTVVH